MALTQDTNRDFYEGEIQLYPVKASSTIYKGSAVGEDAAGYARALVAGDKFLGFCLEGADNASGAAGAINVKVRKKGVLSLAVSGLAVTDNDGVPVYASDDGTFTKTASGNSFIGFVRYYESSGIGLVEYNSMLSGILGLLSNAIPQSASFSIGAEGSNAITVGVQLKDANGNDLASRAGVIAYLASDATGDTLEAASGTLSVAAGTDGMLSELATDNTFLLVSEADGDIDVVVTQTSGVDTHYLILVMPDGSLVASGAITFA